MNKISGTQLFSILICIRAFGLICSGVVADASQMAGAAISTALQFAFAIPMIMLYKKYNFNLRNDLIFGNFGRLLYIVYFIAGGAAAFSSLWDVSKSVYFPVDNSLACAVITAAVCLYCATLGFSALSRSSVITAGILFFSVAVLIFGAVPNAELSNYVPDAEIRRSLSAALENFCSSGELVILFIILDGSSKSSRGITAFFASSFLMTELLYIIEITVLGNLIGISDFPFFSAGAFSQPMSIQRSDSLYMVTFTLLCVLTITTQLIISSTLIKQLMPELRYSKLVSIMLMLCLSAALGSVDFDIAIPMGIMTAVLSVILPTIMLIRRIFDEKRNSRPVSGNADSVRVQS